MPLLYERLDTLFAWVLRSTVQASVLAMVIFAIQFALRKRLPARWQYLLWLVLLVRVALPWAPESPTSMFNAARLFEAETHPMEGQAVSSPERSTTAIPVAIDAQSSSTEAAAAEARVSHGPEPKSLVRVLLPSRESAPALAWAAGAIALALYAAARNLSLWTHIRGQRPITDARRLDLLEECKERMGVRTPVTLVESMRMGAPALVGFIRPRLVLPANNALPLSAEEQRFIFLHELAHLKRNDILVNWFMLALQVLHWFNPIIWIAFRRMIADREGACDALALSRAGAEHAQEYGLTILRLLDRTPRLVIVPGAAGILEDKGQLKRRITMIAQFTPNAYRWSSLALAALTILALVGLTNPTRAEDRIEPAQSGAAARVSNYEAAPAFPAPATIDSATQRQTSAFPDSPTSDSLREVRLKIAEGEGRRKVILEKMNELTKMAGRPTPEAEAVQKALDRQLELAEKDSDRVNKMYKQGLASDSEILQNEVKIQKAREKAESNKDARQRASEAALAPLRDLLNSVDVELGGLRAKLVEATNESFLSANGRQAIKESSPQANAIQPPDEAQLRALCANNLKEVGLLLKMFRDEHKGLMPGLDSRPGQLMFNAKELFPEYMTNDMVMVCPVVQAQSGITEADALNATPKLINCESYFYLNYVVTNDEDGLAFVKAYRESPGDPNRERSRNGAGAARELNETKRAFFAVKDGVERFIKNADGSAVTQHQIPIMIERPGHHQPNGGHVLYMDGYVEFIKYPGKFPMTEKFIQALLDLDAPKGGPGQAEMVNPSVKAAGEANSAVEPKEPAVGVLPPAVAEKSVTP